MEMELCDLEFLRNIHVLGGEVVGLPLGDSVCHEWCEVHLSRELVWQPHTFVLEIVRVRGTIEIFVMFEKTILFIRDCLRRCL